MTDLLDQLAELNPVPACDPPSIEDVWRRLGARGEEPEAGNGRVSRAMRTLPALVGVAVCLAVVVIVAITGPRSGRVPSGDGPESSLRSQPRWNASDAQHPSLSALMAHFAMLRRAPTAADRAAVPRFTFAVGTPGRNEAPTLVRLAGAPNGIPVYFVIFANHRHGATGPVLSYSMNIISGSGNPYAASSYLIFPTVETSGKRSEYLSVVPDGVRSVRWRFACPSGATGCMLPGGRRTVSVPVRGNLAALGVARPNPGAFYADALSVTWYRDDGTHTTYTNRNTAVPFAGAPAWPSRRRSASR